MVEALPPTWESWVRIPMVHMMVLMFFCFFGVSSLTYGYARQSMGTSSKKAEKDRNHHVPQVNTWPNTVDTHLM